LARLELTLGAALVAAALSVSCRSIAGIEPRRAVRGPIPARAEHPLALNYLGMRARRATTQPEDTLGVALESAYASLFEDGADATGSVLVDGELWHGSARLRWGLGPRTDVELELQLLRAGGGFLDGFVEGFHDLFGLANGGREDREDDQLEVEIVADGETVYELEGNAIELGDLPLVLTHELWRDADASSFVAARFGIELPTGSESRGYGNGGIDFGAGLLAERSFGNWTAFGAADVVLPAERDSFEGTDFEVDERIDAAFGLEWRWDDFTSLLAGLRYLSPLSDDIEIEELDAPLLDLGAGAAWDVPERSRLPVSFHVYLWAGSGPDFTVRVGWSWRF
jgi:hypothetical protein